LQAIAGKIAFENILVEIEAAQSVAGANPLGVGFVLEYAIYYIAWQAMFFGENHAVTRFGI